MTIKSPATQSPVISNSTDLVLQLAGGDRHGQLLPVSTAKCLLSSLIADKTAAEKYRCAIFRGEKGVAFRSYSELVLVNGNKTSVQWLKEGDTIQLTPEMKVVVKQLGTFAPTKPTNTSKVTLPAARQVASTISMDSASDGGSPTSGKVVAEAPVNTKPAAAPISVPKESQVSPSVDHNAGQRMEVLSDQLKTLVDAASGSGTVTAAAELKNEPASDRPAAEPLSDQKMADASSSIQDYLDKALASPGNDSNTSPTPTPTPPMPADPVAATTESRKPEATLELTASSVADNVAKLRKEEVASSLNRLLSGTEQTPVGQDLLAPSSAITAADQSSVTPKTSSVLLPETAQTTSEVLASDILAESPIAPPAQATAVATQPAAADPVEAAAPVDVPKAQSLEFLKSLGIDADELGLNKKTPAQENPTPAVPQPVLPVEGAPSVALPTADEIIASASLGSVAQGDSASVVPAEIVVEEEAAEPAAEPAAKPQKAESVADVLARMQNAGSLDSFSMDGPAEEASSEPVASVPAEVARPKPQVSETVVVEEPTESESAGDEDNSVEDYMSQLLNRMRGGDDAEETEGKKSEAAKPAPKKEVAAKTEIVETAEVEQPQKTLTAEQFVPKEKAVRMKSFDSLREIANNSNRSAIQDHLANQRKVSTQTKLQLALISLGFGILFFLMSCMFSAKISIGGMFCGIIFLLCGVVFAKYYRDEKKLDESITQAQKAKA
jgi:hypothetical protein